MHASLRLVLSSIVLAGLLAACARKTAPEAPPSKAGEPPAMPNSFSIEYRMITFFPTCRGNTRVKIDGDGHVWFQRSDRDCPQGEHFSAPYPEKPKTALGQGAIRRLQRLVDDGGFFTLAPPPRGPVSDGYREELEVTLDGRTRTVTVFDGARLAGWDELKAAMLEHTR